MEDPITDAERVEVAHTCSEGLELPMPTLVDGVDDKVGKAYAAWPDRLVLIGRDGRVAFGGAPGPAGFDPEAWEKAIVAEKAKNAAAEATKQPPPAESSKVEPQRASGSGG